MIIRVLSSADHHFDHRSRFEECVRVHDWIADLAAERDVDLYLSGGDSYHRPSVPREREAVAQYLTRVAEQCPVGIVKGNHDSEQDVAFMRRIRSLHPIVVEEAAGMHAFKTRQRNRFIGVAMMAWPEPAAIRALSRTPDEAEQDIRQALQNVLRALGNDLSFVTHCPRILLGHFMVDGAVTSTGQPLLGQPINVGLEDLALARAELTLMGHIHNAQRWELPSGKPALYTGSPYRTTFGQLERKTVVLATFHDDKLVELEEIETPATPMVQVEYTFSGGFPIPSSHNIPDVNGAELRLRYHTTSADREAARRAMRELVDLAKGDGAVSVKLDEVIVVETRVRMPEVQQAETPRDKLQALWKAKGFDPGPRRAPLLNKFDQLERGRAARA